MENANLDNQGRESVLAHVTNKENTKVSTSMAENLKRVVKTTSDWSRMTIHLSVAHIKAKVFTPIVEYLKRAGQTTFDWSRIKLQGNVAPVLKSAGVAPSAIAALSSVTYLISFFEHTEIKVIFDCLILLSLLWCMSCTSFKGRAVGLNNADAKLNRLLRILPLHLAYVISVWMFSQASVINKLYLTAIMLADPLTFVVYLSPNLQRAVQQGWQVLKTYIDQPSVTILKIIALLSITAYTTIHTSALAGLYKAWCLFLCYYSPYAIYILNSNLIATVRSFTDIAGAELTYAYPEFRRSSSDREHRDPWPAEVDAKEMNMRTRCGVVHYCIAALLFVALIIAFDGAQSKKLLWLSATYPQGFFSIIALPNLILSADFVLDMISTAKQHFDMTNFLWAGFGQICFFALIMNMALGVIVIIPLENALFLCLGIVAWFACVLRQYLCLVSNSDELYTILISMLMICYSITWAAALGLPL